jgi:hypothetical protein
MIITGGFEVGLLGGSGDGQLVCVPSDPDALGPPRTMQIPEMHQGPDGGDISVVVSYHLRVNEADEGPLWFYQRDPSAPEPHGVSIEDQPIVGAARRILEGGDHGR